MVKTSDTIAADVTVAARPAKSTERGVEFEACYGFGAIRVPTKQTQKHT